MVLTSILFPKLLHKVKVDHHPDINGKVEILEKKRPLFLWCFISKTRRSLLFGCVLLCFTVLFRVDRVFLWLLLGLTMIVSEWQVFRLKHNIHPLLPHVFVLLQSVRVLTLKYYCFSANIFPKWIIFPRHKLWIRSCAQEKKREEAANAWDSRRMKAREISCFAKRVFSPLTLLCCRRREVTNRSVFFDITSTSHQELPSKLIQATIKIPSHVWREVEPGFGWSPKDCLWDRENQENSHQWTICCQDNHYWRTCQQLAHCLWNLQLWRQAWIPCLSMGRGHGVHSWIQDRSKKEDWNWNVRRSLSSSWNQRCWSYSCQDLQKEGVCWALPRSRLRTTLLNPCPTEPPKHCSIGWCLWINQDWEDVLVQSNGSLRLSWEGCLWTRNYPWVSG